MKYKNQVILAVAIMLFIIFIATTSMATTAIVTTDTLNLRKEASTNATILEQLDKNQKLDVIEQSGDWVKVKVSGITGFVHKDYVKIQEDDNKNEEVQNIVTENNIISENTITENIIETENTITENVVEPANSTIVEETNTSVVREVTLKSDSDVSILPLINATKIANVKKDEKVTVMDEVKGWLYIQTEDANGWVRSSIIEESTIPTNVETPTNNTQATEEKPKNTADTNNSISETKIEEKTMYVNYSSIYVRKGPSTSEEVVDTLILNSQVTVIAEDGDWYKVKVAGKEGYIAKRLLSNSKTESTSRSADEREETQVEQNENSAETIVVASSKGQEIVNYAKQYLGCKYVYGASGPSTFDCSGFTMYVYKNFGISLSHSAIAQSKNGTYVAKEDLQPGDLVFFKDYETMDGIGHCGIYVGDGNFIHASSGTGYCVKISTLLSGSYKTRYETARRLV